MDLVLEGGGVKGIGLVGAIAALEKAGYAVGPLCRVAGTSAGAVVGSLAAAGATAADLTRIMRDLDYTTFQDAPMFGKLGAYLSIGMHLGLYKGDALHEWISQQLAARGVETFGDLRVDDPGSALPGGQQYRLVVVVSDISRGRMVRLPWDYRSVYGLDPDRMRVADAVRASASIPFFYRPVRLAPGGRGVPSCLVDGGMLSNYPMQLFDRTDGKAPRWPTFGVKLSAAPPQDGADTTYPVTNLVELAKRLVTTMVEAHDRTYVSQDSVRDRTIFVDTDGISATDFGLSALNRDLLFKAGLKAGEEFTQGL